MPTDRRGGAMEEVRLRNVLIDVNVLLDVFLERKLRADDA
jgi:hypothetical protein